MNRWSAATSDEVLKIVERELCVCPDELATFFDTIKVPLRQASILRDGAVEHVFVVAEYEGVAVYYEDVEEGFNLSRLAADGSIATPGFEQWELRHALFLLQAQLRC